MKYRSMLRSEERLELLGRVTENLQHGEPDTWLGPVLDDLLHHFQCSAGTIHLLHESGFLDLVAQRGIPEIVLTKIERIPVGKGMAGIAVERRKAIQVCNLQTDMSDVVRPGARDTKMEGSVAAPMISADGALKGALGIAKSVSYEFTPEESDLLVDVGALIAARLP